MSRREFLKLGGAGVVGAALLGVMGSSGVLAQSSGGLVSEVEAASAEYGVPAELLLALGYANSRWEMPPVEAAGFTPGDIHGMGGFGIMHLKEDPKNDTLSLASELTGIPEEKLKTDRAANILGAAAVLSEMRGGASDDLNEWYETVSEYGDSDVYANQVYETLEEGAEAETPDGETVELAPQEEVETRPVYSLSAAADYPGARWYGAYSGNYTRGRQGYGISKIVVHVMQGSWSSAINWFRDSRAGVSCHYNIRSKDGFIGQSVRERDTGYHAGHWVTNLTSVGIEHEGYVTQPAYFTDAMYRSSARLAAHLCNKYNIPVSRNNIIGHHEVPGCSGPGGGSACHTDPGRHWDWDRYMNLIRGYAGGSQPRPKKPRKPRRRVKGQVIDNTTRGRFKASRRWGVSQYSPQKVGSNYRFARPGGKLDPARYRVPIPKRDKYTIYGRWPADGGYNPRVQFRIKTARGVRTKMVNQRKNGGRWVKLGTYDMKAGNRWSVQVSRKSRGKGYIVSDAIRVVRK